MIRFQRVLQTCSLALFIFLLWKASYPLHEWLVVDLFLRLDPLVALGSMTAARTFIPGLAWGLVLLASTLLLGRFFCGFICPFGVTIDISDRFTGVSGGRPGEAGEARRRRGWKYLILAFAGGTAVAGISSVFLFSPIPVITRFFSFVLFPLAAAAGDMGGRFLETTASLAGVGTYRSPTITVPVFATNLFVAVSVTAVLLGGIKRRRFWCGSLCPAGALFAMFSVRPVFRRRVSDACNACGKCFSACPSGAVESDYATTAHSECIVCQRCREICPQAAVDFNPAFGKAETSSGMDWARREVLVAGAAGILTAALVISNPRHLHGKLEPAPLRPSSLIRPPGALPEPEFQSRCVRCGKCMKACLTNTLQPVWLASGLSGLWTPAVTPRLAGCDQNCNVCGLVCPTGSIRPLEIQEKMFAKIGTARIITSRCIAWEQDRQCLICDEICPYNAISSRFVDGRPVTVPVIQENRCNGCGYCEQKCPVEGESAIVVEAHGELRLAEGSYMERARRLGLVFHADPAGEDTILLFESPGEYPGDAMDRTDELPPGFLPD